MAKYHVNGAGEAGTCKAAKGGCPFGGESEHYSSPEAARTAFEAKASETYATVAVLSKKTGPVAPDAHVKEAERALLAYEPSMVERDQRQAGGTVRHQLIATGLTDKEVKSRSNSQNYNGMAGIGELKGNYEGMERVVGLSYGPRNGESEKLKAIGEGLANGDYKPEDVQLYKSRGVTFLALRGADSEGWGADWKKQSDVQASTVEAFTKAQKVAYGPNQARGSLAGGSAFVMATKDPAEAKLFEKLKEAHAAGALRVGDSQSTVEKLLYDDRDISREHKSREIAQAIEEKYATEQIQDLKNRMAAKDPNSYIRYSNDDYAYGLGVSRDINKVNYYVSYTGPNGVDRITGDFTKAEAERVLDGDGRRILNDRFYRR